MEVKKLLLFTSIFCLLLGITACNSPSKGSGASSLYSSADRPQSSFGEEESDSFIKLDSTSEEAVFDNEDQGFVYLASEMGATIVQYNGEIVGETFTIPQALDGHTVLSIRNDVFSSFREETVVELRIPSSLYFVTFDLVEAFPSLQEINVYGEITGRLISYDGVLYSKDGSLERYPQGRTDEEFCVPTTVIFPDPIGIIPIRYIGDRAFAGNPYIKTVDCSDNVRSIASAAFKDCTAVTDISAKNVEIVQSDALENTPMLDEAQGFLTVGKVLVRYVGDAEIITEEMFPGEVKYIGYYAFSNLSVKEIYLPTTIAKIYENAFYCCERLVKLRIRHYWLPTIANNGEIFIQTHENFTVYCPKDPYDNAYDNKEGWAKYVSLLQPIWTRVHFEVIDITTDFYYGYTKVQEPAEKIDGKYVVGWYKKVDGVMTDEVLKVGHRWDGLEKEVTYTPKLVEFKTNGLIFYNGEEYSDENIVGVIAIDVGDSYRFDRYGYEINGVYTQFKGDLMNGCYVDGEWLEVAEKDTQYKFVGWECEDELYTQGVWKEQSVYALSLKAVWQKIE